MKKIACFMKNIVTVFYGLALFVFLLIISMTGCNEDKYDPEINPDNFVTTIDHPYFTMTPGKTLVYEGITDEGTETIVVQVTYDTKDIIGVTCTVVWDRVFLEGELIENTFDWFAQDIIGNVWYFGEYSEEIENGDVVSTEGSWEAGVDGAKPGIIMFADLNNGKKPYRQEYYPGVAEDMAKVHKTDETVTIGYGTFDNCVRIVEWSGLEPGKAENKFYSADIGGVIMEEEINGDEVVELVDVILPSSGYDVWAWGHNYNGQLGNGTNTDSNVPVQVTGLTDVTAIAAGGSQHTIALKSDGTVWTWGSNFKGQLGDGTNNNSNVPVQVIDLTNVTAIAVGGAHTIALKSDGTVWTWGVNCFGQLGNDTTIDSSVPVQVTGLTDAIAIAGGTHYTIALRNDSTVWTWGLNFYGQLGNGTYTDSSVPVQVTGLTGVIAVAGGSAHAIALKNDGTVWAWGNNYGGQLGDGTTTNSNVPVQVIGLTGVIAVAGGSGHTIALKNDGTVWTLGENYYGQLGDGTTTNSNVPVQVTGSTGVIAVAGGSDHTIALKNDGTVWTWGRNDYGQLGDGTNTGSNVPVQVTGSTDAVAIAGGWIHTIALR